MVLLVGLLTLCSTLLGGLFALRYKDKLHLILGFSAGAVLGVAFFDLMPEALDIVGSRYSHLAVTTLIAVGFLLFMLLDRFLEIHNQSAEHEETPHHHHHAGGHGALALSLHSFLDGLGVGLAFQVSPTIGLVVAAAVLAHDFSDGINTVNYVVKSEGSNVRALKWLVVDGLAPVLGIVATFFFTLPQATLGLVLALFCGFFLYIGASDLLPESHHRHPTIATTLMTLLGVLVLYLAIHAAAL